MNNKYPSVLISLVSLIMIIPIFGLISSKALAQSGGNNSQGSVNQGNQELQQDLEILENEQTQELREEQEEQKLEQELNIQEKNPDATRIESVPAPGVGDNMPTPPPLGEREIVIPQKELIKTVYSLHY